MPGDLSLYSLPTIVDDENDDLTVTATISGVAINEQMKRDNCADDPTCYIGFDKKAFIFDYPDDYFNDAARGTEMVNFEILV